MLKRNPLENSVDDELPTDEDMALQEHDSRTEPSSQLHQEQSSNALASDDASNQLPQDHASDGVQVSVVSSKADFTPDLEPTEAVLQDERVEEYGDAEIGDGEISGEQTEEDLVEEDADEEYVAEETWFDADTKAFLVSMFVHVAAIVALASFTVASNPEMYRVFLSSAPIDEPVEPLDILSEIAYSETPNSEIGSNSIGENRYGSRRGDYRLRHVRAFRSRYGCHNSKR